jgi:hypothetical protein
VFVCPSQRRLGPFFEFEPTDIAATDHALIVDWISADDFRHQGEIEVADFRIALGETMKHTICRLDRGQFLICRVDRFRSIAQLSHNAGQGPNTLGPILNSRESSCNLPPHSPTHALKPFTQCFGALLLEQRTNEQFGKPGVMARK